MLPTQINSLDFSPIQRANEFARTQAEAERSNLAQEGHATAVLDEDKRQAMAAAAVARQQTEVAAIATHHTLIQQGRHEEAAQIARALQLNIPQGTPTSLPQNINAMQQPPAPMEPSAWSSRPAGARWSTGSARKWTGFAPAAWS